MLISLISNTLSHKYHNKYDKTHVLKCFDSPAPPHSVSGSTSCGETPEPRFEPCWPNLLQPLSSFLSVRIKQVAVSSRRASSRGIPYVSISHPNRGCAAWAEGLPTFGRVTNGADLSPYRESLLEQVLYLGVTEQRLCGGKTPLCLGGAGTPLSSLYYQPQALFEAGRDGAGAGRDSASLPGYCMHNVLEAPPTKASPAFTIEQEGANSHQRSTLR